MANKKTDLRNKINKKTASQKSSKTSNNKKVKKTNKKVKKIASKNKVLKNEVDIQKKEEIKQIELNDLSNLPKSESLKIKEKKKQALKNGKKNKIPRTKKLKKKSKIRLRLTNILEFIKRKKYYIISFIFALILITILLIILPNTDEKIFFSFKEYKIGDKVTLNDNSSWFVIEDSDSSKSKITLLSEKILDINKDKKINNKDKVVYDKDNKCIYDTKKEKNIGYFIENNVKELLKEINNISEIRLLTSDEYINIRKTMDFGYDWKEGNWLASDSLNSWWLETSRYNKIYTVTKRGSYKLSEAKSKNYIRPVIKVDKSSVK